MTNIPFSAEEAQHSLGLGLGLTLTFHPHPHPHPNPSPNQAQYWMPDPLTGAVPPVPACLRPALRVDPLLVGDWAGISAVLARCSPPYPRTLEGCHAFIVDWVRRMRPLYLMA